MFTKNLLTVEDISMMLEAVMSYNRRGSLVGTGIVFYDNNGVALPVAYMEVITDEKGLAVRALPEPTYDELHRMVNPPVQDPRQVLPPATIAELNALEN